MKRHVHLQPLSRQHHNGLLVSLLLVKGLRKNAAVDVMNAFIQHAWQADLSDHFMQEEQVLIPALRETTFDHQLTQRLLTEHEELTRLAHKASENAAGIDDISSFATLLEKHIRFEEKEYFPRAEASLSNEILADVGSKLHEDRSANCINYPIKFWE
jgi:hemerythrin-like domain-containing protein